MTATRCGWRSPGYYGAGSAFVSAGAKLAPLRVSNAGWNLDPPPVVPRMIFVTPSCHHPLGITMPMEQRLNLLHMAESLERRGSSRTISTASTVFRVSPFRRCKGISASNRVVYVGTFAKILFPAMRLGFLVAPEPIRPYDRLGAERDRPVRALADPGRARGLHERGALHPPSQADAAALCGETASIFLESAQRHLGEWLDFHATESGIQVVGIFRGRCSDRAVAEAALQQGINVSAAVDPVPSRHGAERPRHGLRGGRCADDRKDDAEVSHRAAKPFFE